MADRTEWVFDKPQFMRRMTILFGAISTGGMIVMFEPYDTNLALLWLIFAAIGLLMGYVWSLLMWNLFVLPYAKARTNEQPGKR